MKINVLEWEATVEGGAYLLLSDAREIIEDISVDENVLEWEATVNFW